MADQALPDGGVTLGQLVVVADDEPVDHHPPVGPRLDLLIRRFPATVRYRPGRASTASASAGPRIDARGVQPAARNPRPAAPPRPHRPP